MDNEFIILSPQVTFYRILDKQVISRVYLLSTFKSIRFLNNFNVRAQSGSTRAYLGITNQLDLTVLLPKTHIVEEFSEKAENFFKQIERNSLENKTLIKIRDTLLPKLISGEVRLKEFKEQVETII
jgi:type I restriction enzyme S subunit